MTKVAVNEESLTDIADAIRTQNGTQTTYKPSEMGDAIEALQPTVDADAVTVTADNTTQHVYPDTGKYFDEVIVNPAPSVAYPTYVSFYNYQGNTLDLSWLRTTNMTTMANMFDTVKYVDVNLSLFDTSNVTSMQTMFRSYGNYQHSSIDFTSWTGFDTSRVEIFNGMFNGFGGAGGTINISNFNFSKASNLSYMFNGASVSTIILPTNATFLNNANFSGLFMNCSNLTTLNGIENWDTSKVTNFTNLFSGANRLQNLQIQNWDFSSTTGYNLSNLIYNTSTLSAASLNNVLEALQTAPSNYSNKTLKHVGFSSSQASTATGLSNWANLEANGWSTGY